MTMMTKPIGNVALAPPPGLMAGLVLDLPDPLDEDRPDDQVVVTTRRGIVRVALVAAETAGRFQREGVPHDPMSWMLAPRTLFGGIPAIDACLDRDACLRGVLLHGLSLGLDADPRDVDDLTVDDGRDFSPIGLHLVEEPERRGRESSRRLYTAILDVDGAGSESALALCAIVAEDREAVRGRLARRYGGWVMSGATVCDGLLDDPRLEDLAPPSLLSLLRRVAADPGCADGDGLDVTVERRFA